MTRSEFAKQAGVSPPAITGAIRAGIVIISKDENGKEGIEADHPVNRSYLNSAKQNRPKSERQRESAKANHEGRIPEHKKAPTRSGHTQVFSSGQGLDESELDELPSKIEMEIRRLIQQEEKDRIANETAKKNLLPREIFVRKLDKLISVINNHMLPFARRMTPQICGELGISDPEKILKVEEMLNIEMQRALSEFKREAKT